MIGLIALVAARAATPPTLRYALCDASGESVAALREQVRRSHSFKDKPDSGNWHARWNERDIVWLFPDAQSGADIAICRHLVTDANGTSMSTRLICDGSDQACNALRDQLLGQPRPNE